MVIDFQMEAAKRRDDSRKLAGSPTKSLVRNPCDARPQATSRAWPKADWGSAWYHAEAMAPLDKAKSHRDLD